MINSLYSTIRNPKQNFSPLHDREFVTITNPNSYRCKRQRQLGIEVRLYYEFKHCEAVGGRTYFLTLTYNEDHIPTKTFKSIDDESGEVISHTYNVPDKRDVQYLMNHSRFARNLHKRYGYKFKYFVATELGEGGESHNFVGQRGKGNNPHYHVLFFLTPDERQRSKIGYELPYMTDNDFNYLVKRYWQGLYDNGTLKDWKQSDFGHVDVSNLGSRVKSFHSIAYISKYVVKDDSILARESQILSEITAHVNSLASIPDYVKPLYIKEQFQIFKNRHSVKPMFSNGIGISALDTIDDNGKVDYFSAGKPCKVNVPLYLFRKKFTDVVYKLAERYDKVRKTYVQYKQPIYVKNSEGVALTIKKFYTAIEDIQAKCRGVRACLSDKTFLEKYEIHSLPHLTDKIIYRYSLWTSQYKNRFYQNDLFTYFINPDVDVARFCEYNELLPTERRRQVYKSYADHSFFRHFIRTFDWLDTLFNQMDYEDDVYHQEYYDETKRLVKLLKSPSYATI